MRSAGAARKRFDEFCRRLASLRVDRSGGLVKPYKPVMLAAVVILIHKGKILSRNVLLDGGLRSAFFQLLAELFPSWPTTTKAEYPFRHLENDGIWELVPIEGASGSLRAAREARAEAWRVLRHVKCAQLDEAVYAELAGTLGARFRVLQILADTYFSVETSGRLWKYLAAAEPIDVAGSGAEDEQLTERALEEHIEQHWGETPFGRMGVELASPCRQVFTPVSTIDLLGYRPGKREWWVIELKRGRATDQVVGQVSRYLGWVASERCRGRERSVGAIVARQADRKLRYAVSANPRLSLWQFDDALELTQVG